MDDRKALRLARVLTIISAVIHAAVAIVAYKLDQSGSTVTLVLKIAGFSTGLLLGLYGLGLMAPQTRETTAIASFFVGTAFTCWVAFGTDLSGWWYTLVGSTTIVIVGLLFNVLFGVKKQTSRSASN